MACSYQFKLVVVGDSSVGKTCLVLGFTDRNFQMDHNTTCGVDFGARNVNLVDKTPVRLQVWDTAGTDRFRSITRSYYRSVAGALLVYDISQRVTFDNLQTWLQELRDAGVQCIVLVGNKCDREDARQVSEAEGKQFAKENGLIFMETSAKTSLRIDEAFTTVANEIFRSMKQGELQNCRGIKVQDRLPLPQKYHPIDSKRTSCCNVAS